MQLMQLGKYIRGLVAAALLFLPLTAQATNYLTAQGTQQFSITIASGSTTGTATINAVGAGAFIIYGGINPSVSNNPAEDVARITLTNSTTITATRNTGTAGTVVITGCVVDGDTANLIKSVQYGTISIGSFSSVGTATISAVTNNNAAVHLLGFSDTATSYNNLRFPVLSLSGTTVTATTGTTGTRTVGFVVIEFQGGVLNQPVQNFSTASVGTVSSWTATITSVNTSNAILINGGFTFGISSTSPAAGLPRVALTNSTTVTCNVNTASGGSKTCNGSVVEFAAGVLHSAVQRSTTTLTGVTSNTSTITAVAAGSTGISYLGNSATATTAVLNQALADIVLTDATTVTSNKNTATANTTSSWEVFEFPAFVPPVVANTCCYPDQPFFGGWP